MSAESGSVRAHTLLVRRALAGAEALGLAADVAALPLNRIDTLTLSLRRVAALDVSGVAALVRLYSQLKHAGKQLVLSDVPDKLKELLEAGGLLGVIPLAPEPEGRIPILLATQSSNESSAELFFISD